MAEDSLRFYWELFLNGNPLPEEYRSCVSSIETTDQCSGYDSCSITLVDKFFEFLDDNLFVEDATIKLRMYWDGNPELFEFDGNISAVDIDFPEEGIPSVVLFCVDSESHKLNRTKKNRSWKSVTRADVAEKIAKEYGLGFVKQDGYSGKKETITQSSETDIAFLDGLAAEEDYPYLVKIKNGTLYYIKMGALSDPVAEFHYHQEDCSIRSFQPQITSDTIEVEEVQPVVSSRKTEEDPSKSNDYTPPLTGIKPAPSSYMWVYNKKERRWVKIYIPPQVPQGR